MGAIQNLFQKFGQEYIDQFEDRIPKEHVKVIKAIQNCRSEACGYTAFQCENCDHYHFVPRSCGNRHCPGCQHQKNKEWLNKQLKKRLPGHYFMMTFTVPQEIRSFMRSNQKISYNALFAASANTIKGFAENPKFIGGQFPGFTGVLHTWGRQTQYHPHIHYVVAGGALSKDKKTWHPSRTDFFAPVNAMAKVFKEKFKEKMAAAKIIDDIPEQVWTKTWNVNCQPVGNAEPSFQYLSNYVFKVAINDSRIVEIAGRNVSFRWKKSGSNRRRITTIDVMEFIRRFLQHVLPNGFMKVRYYGICSGAFKIDWQQLITLVQLVFAFELPFENEEIEQYTPQPIYCPRCNAKMRYYDTILPMGQLFISLKDLLAKKRLQIPLRQFN